MCGAASWSVCGVTVGPPVITRLPLTVHLTATSWTCGGVIAASSLLRALQSISGFTRSSFLMPRVAKSTNRLGLGGWAPAAAKKVQGGFFGGADDFCLLLPAVVSLLEGGGAFFKASTALDSCMSESWIFWSSRFGTMSAVGGAGALLWPMSSLMTGWEMKVRRCGFTLANCTFGEVLIVMLRRFSKAWAGMGILDMVVV